MYILFFKGVFKEKKNLADIVIVSDLELIGYLVSVSEKNQALPVRMLLF